MQAQGSSHVGDGHGEGLEVFVMIIEERAGEHVGAGEREFEWTAGDGGGARTIFVQVEDAFSDRAANDTCGLAAEAHLLLRAKRGRIGQADRGRDATHARNKILDHAIGVGMVDVEAVKFAVGGQIDSCAALGVDDDGSRIKDRLFARQGREPVDRGVRADSGGKDFRGVGFHGIS